MLRRRPHLLRPHRQKRARQKSCRHALPLGRRKCRSGSLAVLRDEVVMPRMGRGCSRPNTPVCRLAPTVRRNLLSTQALETGAAHGTPFAGAPRGRPPQMVTGVWRDIRFAVRMMAKTRGLTSVALITLALGIGANTAVYSVIDAILIRPLPYAAPERLVMVFQDLRGRGGPATEWTGPANQSDWKAATDVFAGVTTVRGWAATLAAGDTPAALTGEQTTFEYFDVLGARPELGRSFRAADDTKDARRVVILSHGLWTSRFGADPSAIGRVVAIGGEPHEIIGVMPASFRPAYLPRAALWRPLRWPTVNAPRNVAVGHTIGRLREGVTLDQARARLDALAARLRQAHPDADAGKGINAVPLQEQQVGGVRLGLFVLLGAVGCVLLIACVNIANLLLARASGRARE